MWKNGYNLSWEAIERLYDVSISDKYVGHNLTRGHVKLTAFSRMNVKLAIQVMSRSVAYCLKHYETDPRFNNMINAPLIEFIEVESRQYNL